MKSGRSLIFAAVATASVSVCAVSAGAQPIASGSSRVELGATAVGIGGPLDLSDFKGDWQGGSTGGGLFAVFNPSTTIGIEFSGEALRLQPVQVRFYGATLVIRQIRDASRSFTFWRVGAGGRHEFERVVEYQRQNQDLSRTVYPAYDHHKVTAHAIVGWGIQRALAEHVAFRAEWNALIGRRLGDVGGRASAGIVVGLGTHDRSR